MAGLYQLRERLRGCWEGRNGRPEWCLRPSARLTTSNPPALGVHGCVPLPVPNLLSLYVPF